MHEAIHIHTGYTRCEWILYNAPWH